MIDLLLHVLRAILGVIAFYTKDLSIFFYGSFKNSNMRQGPQSDEISAQIEN